MNENNIKSDLFLQESLNLKDLLFSLLKKWYWFVISILISITIAIFYIMCTPLIYTRSASLLIKEDNKSNSPSGNAGVLYDLDLFQTGTNVNNEIQSLQSPAVMYDVVKRLHLNINYNTKGVFYNHILYGQNCPYEVEFFDLQDNEVASFTIFPVSGNKGVELTDFIHGGEESDKRIVVEFNDTISTPVGRLLIKPTHGIKDFKETVYISHSGLQAATSVYSGKLTVALKDEKSTVINLSIEDVCIQRAEDVLNTLIAVYNENWVKDKNQIAVSTSMFINERLEVIEQELGHVDENISSYKSENLLPDVQAAANMYMTQSNATNSQILVLNTQLAMTRYVRNYLTNNNNKNQLLPANSGIESSGIENQILDYNTLQLQRNNLVANSSVNNPLVADMDQSLQNMRNAIISSIDNHITTLNTQIKALQQSERQTTARIAANPTQGKYLLSVERQQKVKEALYLFLLQKREENELSQAFTAYNTRIIMPPSGSMYPTSPNKKKIIMVAFVLGLILPACIIFAQKQLYTKVRGRKDLEFLSLPFVGEIPLAYKKKNSQESGKEESHFTILIKQGSRDVLNEAFRVLRTNIEFILNANNTGMADVVIVTSFNPGSGKTFVTINIAASLSLKGKKVLVIDGDLRKGTLSHYLRSHTKGLSDYLGKREDNPQTLIQDVPNYPGLSILPVGTIPPNPTELLAESRFSEFIEKVRVEYDCIFIDCPPIDIVADTQIIGQYADRTLFVIRAGLLEREMLPELQRAYDDKKFKNMAVILNGTDRGSGRYGYKYVYHYGYGNENYLAKDKN